MQLPQGEPDRYAGQWHVVVRHDGKQCVATGVPSAATWTAGPTGGAPTGLSATHVSVNEGVGFGFTSKRCKPNVTDPVMYGIALGAGSNFQMFPFMEPGIVTVGDPIRLNALVIEFSLPVIGCTVTVDAREGRSPRSRSTTMAHTMTVPRTTATTAADSCTHSRRGCTSSSSARAAPAWMVSR